MMGNEMSMRGLFSFAILWLLCDSGAAEDIKPEEPKAPRINVVLPLGIAPGVASRITIRGQNLDTATEVRVKDLNVPVTIHAKGAAAASDKLDPMKVGGTQIEAELTLPADVAGGSVSLVAITPVGESPPHVLLATATVPETERNDGFRQAQVLSAGSILQGQIEARNVDVFRFDGQAGQRVVFEVFAARHGSGLDSILTLYDSQGRILGSQDDQGEILDSRLEVTLPAAGAYYLSLMDAHDLGGPVHVYRLTATVLP